MAFKKKNQMLYVLVLLEKENAISNHGGF